MKNQRQSRQSNMPRVILGIFVVVLALSVLDFVPIVWLLVAVAIIYGLGMVWKHGMRWWRSRNSKVAQNERFLLMLAGLMALFLATGTAFYLMAFTIEAAEGSSDGGCCSDGPFLFINAEYLFRSLTSSFLLFTGNLDSDVLNGIASHQYVKGLISVQAILSSLCTAAVLLSLVYARLSAYYKLHKKTRMDQQHNHLYVFFGMNGPSKLLAGSIKEREGEKAVVVFVENSHVDDNAQNGWSNIIGMFTHRMQTFVDVDDLDACVTFTEIRLCDIGNERQDGNTEVDVLEEINLLKLKELIGQLERGIEDAQLHIFFLSDNEDENIRALSTLALDKTIHQISSNANVGEQHIKQRFYCHARQNGLNRVVEDIAVKRGLEVRIVDSSHLAVELLKADEKNQPVRLVDLDTEHPTTVSSPFTSLIVGFDEVGHDALKFLYEFGAFVDSKASPTDERRSPFRCVVVDVRMDEQKGVFSTFAPAVMQQKNRDGSSLVELRQCNCLSGEFFSDVVSPDFCKVLNYIVIAVGDDERGMMLAIRLLNHIRREREDLSRLRIFVRSYSADKEAYMQRIANHYNEGYNADCKNEAYKTEALIIPFGQMRQIYSFDMIVNEELTEKGKTFQAGYARLKGEKVLWDARRAKELKKGSINSLRTLRRKESQDLANALHASTKMYLLKEALSKAVGAEYDWGKFLDAYFDENGNTKCEGAYDEIDYPGLSPLEKEAILNLARLEHLRWVASHEMLGYIRPHTDHTELHCCDERTREHNCLIPWQELDEEGRTVTREEGWKCDYKSFDFAVVDTSILLSKDKL